MSDCRNGGRDALVGGVNVLRRWDPAAGRYEPHEVPAGWKVSAYEPNYAERVNCASCGRELPWGETYTSLEVHTRGGFGYGVCEGCYDKEVRRRRAAGKDGRKR